MDLRTAGMRGAPGALLSGVAFATALLLASSGFAQTLNPFKDELFAYPAVLSQEDGGRYKIVDYQEMRDINGRDVVPERRVKSQYISTGVNSAQRDLVLKTDDGRKIRHYAVGRTDGAAFVVFYLHGRGGSRQQGVNDYTFGGNFNRIKNLAVANGGLYIVPDFPDFAEGGVDDVGALVDYYAAKSPGAPVVIACGSMGGYICWGLAKGATGDRLAGLMLLGSVWDDDFKGSASFKRKIPVFFGQGSRDPVFAIDKQEAFFRSLGKTYPTKFVRFETGNHGTPIRMTDWRDVLNWIFAGGR